MTCLYLSPHPLGVVIRTALEPGERDIVGDVSELVCEGESFGGLSCRQLIHLAAERGGTIHHTDLAEP